MIQLFVAYLAKASLVLAIAALLARCLSLSPEMRHRIWILGFAAVLLMLPLSYFLPPVHLGLRQYARAGVGLNVAMISWLAVAILLLARIVLDQVTLKRLRADTAVVRDGALLDLANEVRAEMKVARAVQIRHWQGSMPATFGIFRPVILLPAAAGSWPADRLKLTLLHEMGHVARFDAVSNLLSRLVTAFHWFNPLCLWALGTARTNCEYACDDLVLRTGAKARNYARALIDTARDNAADNAVARLGILTMTPARNLEDRVTRLFASKRSQEGRRHLFLLAATALVIVGGLIAPARLETPDPWSYAR